MRTAVQTGRRWRLAACLLALATSAQAEPWTLPAALARAREASPEVVLAARRLSEAEASRVGQGVPLTNPRLYGDYRFLAKEQPGTPSDPFNGYLLGIDGQFEVSNASGKRLDEADRRVALALAELEEERIRAAARAWNAWVDVRVAERLVLSSREAVELQECVERSARARLDTGVTGEPDLTTVAVELAQVRVDLEDALRRQHAALLALKDVLDLPPGAAFELTGTPLDLRPVPDEASAMARALDKRPELVAQRARLALLEATDTRLSREAFPRLGVNLGLDGAPASPVFGFVGLAVELPVAQRNQGPRAVAQAARDTELLRLGVLERRIAREVALARGNYEARVKALELLTRDALPNAERTQALVEEGWRAGRFDVFRLTAATRELLHVRRERLETLAAAWRDYIELERASGGLTP
jgi:cobalt-zinc-cadmium efflux system outer membrane protein